MILSLFVSHICSAPILLYRADDTEASAAPKATQFCWLIRGCVTPGHCALSKHSLLLHVNAKMDAVRILIYVCPYVCATVLGLWPSPLGRALDTLQGFQGQGSLGGGDLLEYFPRLTRMTESLSLLNSGSSSPVDSETSGVSSGSDHLVSNPKK